MILLIDNYDSFSYNLVHLIGKQQPDIQVVRNDQITLAEVERLHPEAIVLSPGPGRPEQAGICVEIVRNLGNKIPILGVCLGHQAICYAYGAQITYAAQLVHGKTSVIRTQPGSRLFHEMETEIKVGRYHSLATSRLTMPEELEITAETEDGEIMAVEHRKYPVFGVQFHPESILTDYGSKMIENFLRQVKQEGKHHD
ncbi:MAG: anthranilate synthase component II [Lachnospiraceae bacterium]